MNPSNFQFSSLERIMIESQRWVMCLPFLSFFFLMMISRGSFKVSIVTSKESSFSAVISQQRKEYWCPWLSRNEKDGTRISLNWSV